MRTMFSLLLSLTAVSMCMALQVTTDPEKQGLVQSTVMLKCSFSAPSNANGKVIILWHFIPEKGGFDEIIYSKTDGAGGSAHGRFAGRASVSGSQADLTISRLEVQDAGTYRCQVDFYFAKQEGESTTRLIVNNVPELVDIKNYGRGEYVFAKPGVNTMFECHATNAKPAPKLWWYLGTKRIETAVQRNELNQDGTFNTISELSFKSVKEDHNQVLKCESNQEPEIPAQYKSDTIIVNTSGAITKTLSVLLLLACIVVGQFMSR